MRRVGFALVALVVLVACSGQTGQPGPTASASRTASPARATSPTPGPVARVDFSCRLPIYSADRQGAFVNFPQGNVTVDPRGSNSLFYDLAYTRWLPVPRQAVSADGRQYASITGTSIRVVDVGGGGERSFPLPDPAGAGTYTVVDFATEGIYLGLGAESGLTGLWRMDPASGAVTRVAQLTGFQVHGSDREFWVGSANGAQSDQVDRLDLSDGYRETWFNRPGARVWVTAVDRQDHPIAFAVDGDSGEGLLLLEPKRQASLFKASADFVARLGIPASDSHGIWFGSESGIYLYSDAGGFRKVSNQPGYPAGFCA